MSQLVNVTPVLIQVTTNITNLYSYSIRQNISIPSTFSYFVKWSSAWSF